MNEIFESRRTDSASLLIDAPADVIYRAFVDPIAWLEWLPPQGMKGHLYEFDAQPGGTYRLELTHPADHPGAGKTSENTDVVEGRFIELIPNERVVHLITFKSEDPAFAGEMRMIWNLSPAQGKTKVSITAENVPPGISKRDHDEGIRSTLENLANFLK